MEALLTWNCYEHAHVERGRDWYWALGIITVSASLASFILSNVLFALILILAGCVLALIASQPPELTEVNIFTRGFRIGDITHRWEDVISFWIDVEGDVPTLLIDTTKILSPNIVLPLTDIDPSLVREVLLNFAEERFLKEPVSHKLVELLGF